jgi:DNA-binding transcriptional regulator GbsR (MarR family)
MEIQANAVGAQADGFSNVVGDGQAADLDADVAAHGLSAPLARASMEPYDEIASTEKGCIVMQPSPATPPPGAPGELNRAMDQVERGFIDLWRGMSSLWGISPTMAEIHGLLFITGEALSMDDIMKRLSISRGNVSMNLTKLLEWGLVRRVHVRGDRRDYYESLSDVWEIFTLVAAQRKRREIDPMLYTLRQCGEQLSTEKLGPLADDERAVDRRRRVDDLLAFLTLVDGLAQRFFESHKSLRTAVELLARKEAE